MELTGKKVVEKGDLQQTHCFINEEEEKSLNDLRRQG